MTSIDATFPPMLKGKALFVFCTQTDGQLVWTPLRLLDVCVNKVQSGLCGMGSEVQTQLLLLSATGGGCMKSHFHWQKAIHCLSENQTIIWSPQSTSHYKMNPYVVMHYEYNVVLSFTVFLYLWLVCFGHIKKNKITYSLCNAMFVFLSCFSQIPFVLQRGAFSFRIWCLLTQQEHCPGKLEMVTKFT